MNLIKSAAQQWRNRPNDERFTSLIAMQSYLKHLTENSYEDVVDLQEYEFTSEDDEIILKSRFGDSPRLSNHAFNQISARLNAPASYLKTLPTNIAVEALNHGIKQREDNVKLFIRGTNETSLLRSVTGPRYGRIFNLDIVNELIRRFGNGLTGQFRIPGIYKNAVEKVTIENTTLFASEKDMFVFLVNEDPNDKIEVKNRRDGKPGYLSRGFLLWNSETGSSTFGISTFLYDYICSNKVIFGATDIVSFKLRHTSRAPEYIAQELEPKLIEYSRASILPFQRQVEKAQQAKIDNDFLVKILGPKLAATVSQKHVSEENRPIETIWDASVGVTAYARDLSVSEDRVALERQGGDILNLA